MMKRTAMMLLATTAALSLAACASSTKASGPVTLPSISAVPTTASSSPATTDSSSPSAAPTTDSPSASPSATASATASSSASSSASASTGPVAGGACATSQLAVSLGQGQGAAGSQIMPLVFTNTGSTACTLSGYPGVSFVTGSAGTQVGAAATRDGGSGSAVSLAASGTGQSLVKIANTENFPAASCKPIDVRGLRVFPPGQKAALFVALPDGTTACSAAGVNQLGVQSVMAS